MTMFKLVLAILLVGIATVAEAQGRGQLYGQAIVCDPGHGGTDPGASRMFGGSRVAENEYVYDVCLRVERLVRQKSGLAFLTLKRDEGIRSGSPRDILFDNRTERFAYDNSVARAGSTGLRTRQAYGNLIARRYPRHQLTWISVHFDVVGKRSDVDGVRIIYAKKSPGSLALARELEDSFDDAGRMREHGPIAESGDLRYGLRNLYILNGNNRASSRVLIELGNFNNNVDLWRIRDPKVREAYAKAIVEALVKRVKKTAPKKKGR